MNNKYIGKSCPFCKTEIRADDEIVICSECEMPHHLECWIENQGCTTFGCLGTIDVANSNVTSVTTDRLDFSAPPSNVTYCPSCGVQNDAESLFCAACGHPLTTQPTPPVPQSQPAAPVAQPAPYTAAVPYAPQPAVAAPVQVPAPNPYAPQPAVAAPVQVPAPNPYVPQPAVAAPVQAPMPNPYAPQPAVAAPVQTPAPNPYAPQPAVSAPVQAPTPNPYAPQPAVSAPVQAPTPNPYAPQPAVVAPAPNQPAQNVHNVPIDDTLKLLIGENATYYATKFHEIKNLKKIVNWNWMAFAISPIWLINRKMLGFGIGMLAAAFFAFLTGIPFLIFLYLGGHVALGLFGNLLYMKMLEKKADEAKNMTEPFKSQFIAKNSGTDRKSAMIASIVTAAVGTTAALIALIVAIA